MPTPASDIAELSAAVPPCAAAKQLLYVMMSFLVQEFLRGATSRRWTFGFAFYYAPLSGMGDELSSAG